MAIIELLDQYEYNRWAHERTLDAADDLSPEQYDRALPGSFPSLRATLEHLLAAEVVWLARWQGHSLADPPDFAECADAGALRIRWQSYWNRQFRFLHELTEEQLTQPVAIRMRNGIETTQPLRDTMMHLVNHSTYHRGQAATLIRQLGGNPQSTDYFTYCLVRGTDPEPQD